MSVVSEGGWVLISIVGLSMFAWSLIMHRVFFLKSEAREHRELAEKVIRYLRAGDARGAETACRNQHGAIPRMIAAVLNIQATGRRLSKRDARATLVRERVYLRRYFDLVAVIGAALPLLGLLGTVLGIAKTLGALAQHSGLEPSAAMAGGISQALITTQAGLVTALPVILMHGWMSSRVRRCMDEGARVMKVLEGLSRPGVRHV